MRQHIPLAEYRSNLAKVVGHVRGLGLERVLLITPTPVYEEGRIAYRLEVGGKGVAGAGMQVAAGGRCGPVLHSLARGWVGGWVGG